MILSLSLSLSLSPFLSLCADVCMCVYVCVCVFCEGLNLTDILYRMLRDKDPLVRRDRVQGGGT